MCECTDIIVDLSCVGQDVAIKPGFKLLANEINPVVFESGECVENECGTLTLSGCEVDVLGRLVARNIKIVLPEENGECDCGLQVGECRRCNYDGGLRRIVNHTRSNVIENLPSLVLDLVESIQKQQLELDSLRALLDE